MSEEVRPAEEAGRGLKRLKREALERAAEMFARPPCPELFSEEWEEEEGWRSAAEVEPWPDPITECFERAGMYLHVRETPFGMMVYRLPWNERYCERCQS